LRLSTGNLPVSQQYHFAAYLIAKTTIYFAVGKSYFAGGACKNSPTAVKPPTNFVSI
jgi:hypothetical protein